jgi:hypothetical protein
VKLPRDLSGQQVVRALRRLGFEVTRQAGSHVRLAHADRRVTGSEGSEPFSIATKFNRIKRLAPHFTCLSSPPMAHHGSGARRSPYQHANVAPRSRKAPKGRPAPSSAWPKSTITAAPAPPKLPKHFVPRATVKSGTDRPRGRGGRLNVPGAKSARSNTKQNCGTNPNSPNPRKIHHIADVARASGRQGRRPRRPLPPAPTPATSSAAAQPPSVPGTPVTGLQTRHTHPSQSKFRVNPRSSAVKLLPPFPKPANAGHRFRKYISPNKINNMQPPCKHPPPEMLAPPGYSVARRPSSREGGVAGPVHGV